MDLGLDRSRETRLCEGIDTVEELNEKQKGREGKGKKKKGGRRERNLA